MRHRALAIFLALTALTTAAGAASAQTLTIDAENRTITQAMRPLPLHVVGRVKIVPLASPLPTGVAYVHQWPGVYFEGVFRGDRVALKFDDAANEYRLRFDDHEPITLAQLGRVEVLVSGLGPGRHRARLEKVTESVDQIGAFDGFYVLAGQTDPAPPPRVRQIEFIGDSSMSGYGDRSPTRTCTREEVRLSTDTQLAYPALVARHFDADYQINAISGRGLVRNIQGLKPDSPLPRLYPYAVFDQPIAYDPVGWRPQIVVIKLTADFAGPYKPGESWNRQEDVAPHYVKAMIAFVDALSQRAPDATVLIWWYDPAEMQEPAASLVRNMQRQIARGVQGKTRIDFLPMHDLGFESSGCDYHASLADHRKTAEWLMSYLQSHPEYWRGK